MKIRVKAFLTLRQALGNRGSLEMETGEITIRELLTVLCRDHGEGLEKMIFDPCANMLSSYTKVLVNGRHYSTLPDKLDTRLKEGDEVALFPPLAGG
jgi:MoaD family protein